MTVKVDPYPLQWPLAHRRTRASDRKQARFGRMVEQRGALRSDGTRSSWKQKKRWTFAMVRDQLLDELERLDVTESVISSNMPLRLDGLPHGGRSPPGDPGVAVYFKRMINGEIRSYVMACDQYDRLADNTRALTLTIESLRRIERHGSSELMEQAFTGFSALPAARTGIRPWREVLEVGLDADMDCVNARYRELVAVTHPDRGGDGDRMAEIADAIRRARTELGRSA